MDKKTLGIGILSLSAVLLTLTTMLIPTSDLQANEVVKDRDYQLITAEVQGGGEGLYVIDSRTGLMAIFAYDPNTRQLEPRAVRAVADAFGGQ